MPTDLAALLVEDGAVSPDALERALERQREAGGALDTALLEQRAISEDVLVGYLARAAELPAAPADAWTGADARARRVFPSRVAERHGLAPFALEGRELALVATFPVDLALLDEISFMLSLHLSAHVAPEWRVRALIHRLYGSPLPERLAALAAADGMPLEPVAEVQAAAEDELGAAPAEDPRPAPPPPSGFSREDSEPLEPLAAALQQALEADGGALFEELVAGEAGARDDAGGGAPEEPPEEEAPRPPPDRSAPPRWSLDEARAALAAARDRDEVVLVALRHARDYFEFAAMFAVTRDAVAGHDALGLDDERERARALAIWASDPGMVKTVLETKSPFLGPPDREAAGTEAIVTGLGREAARAALVFPVLLRDRPVCVLYADNGSAPISVRRLGDLLLFLSGVGPALERIIRDRKDRRVRPGRPATGEERAGAAEAGGAGTPELEAAERTSQSAAAAVEPPAGPLAAEELRAPDGRAPADEERASPAPDAAPARAEAPEREEPGSRPATRSPEIDAALAAFEVDVDLDDLESSVDPHRDLDPARAPGDGRAPPAAAGEETARAAPPGPPADPGDLAPAAGPEREAPPEKTADEAPSLPALADRALDADEAIAGAACDALAAQRRAPGIRAANEKLRRALLSGIAVRSRRAAHALGALRDVEAIPLLIQVLETSEPETAAVAADALTAVTLQRLGPDARRWLAWWKENRGRGRAEWLFSGLTSPDRATRLAASAELSLAAPPPVAYSADLAPAEREQAARAWAVWWARSGLVL